MARLIYSIVQFVGDPVRQEAVNVGVILLGPDAATVRIDGSAPARLRKVWSDFDRRLFYAFARDLRHALAMPHQPFFSEKPVQLESAVKALESIRAAAVNQFQLTEPKPLSSPDGSIRKEADRLFDRFVVSRVRRDQHPGRHMTRSRMREMINEVLGVWASTRAPQLVLAESAQIDGQLAEHTVDLIAYEDAEPRMLFFAAPLEGPQAALIRDALPTVIEDIRQQWPSAEYFAVLGEKPSNGRGTARDPGETARRVLGRVPDLRVFGLSEFRSEFGDETLAF